MTLQEILDAVAAQVQAAYEAGAASVEVVPVEEAVQQAVVAEKAALAGQFQAWFDQYDSAHDSAFNALIASLQPAPVEPVPPIVPEPENPLE